MNLNIENLVRSGVILVVGLPLTLGTALSQMPEGETAVQRSINGFKARLAEPCLDYMFSKGDSKMERTAKNEIDDRIGEGSNYSNVCKYVLNG